MRKLIIAVSIVAVSSFIVAAPSAWCHPPTNIEVAFTEGSLGIAAYHLVPDPNIHYLDRIKVEVNGTTLIEQKFLLQSSGERQTVAYVIPGIKRGDKIRVTAYCNHYGDLSKEIEVP